MSALEDMCFSSPLILSLLYQYNISSPPSSLSRPAVYTFGGDDSARTSSDDLRRLSLHGLAAQPFLTKKNALHHHAGIESAATAVPPAELQRSRCDWMLKVNKCQGP